MQDSIELCKDFVTILVPVVTGYVVLFTGSIGRLWLEHRSPSRTRKIVFILAGLSAVVGLVSLSFCMGVMSLLLKATYGDNQTTFWRGVLDSNELVRYAHDYLMIGWGLFVFSVALGCVSYFHALRGSLTKESSRPPSSAADS